MAATRCWAVGTSALVTLVALACAPRAADALIVLSPQALVDDTVKQIAEENYVPGFTDSYTFAWLTDEQQAQWGLGGVDAPPPVSKRLCATCPDNKADPDTCECMTAPVEGGPAVFGKEYNVFVLPRHWCRDNDRNQCAGPTPFEIANKTWLVDDGTLAFADGAGGAHTGGVAGPTNGFTRDSLLFDLTIHTGPIIEGGCFVCGYEQLTIWAGQVGAGAVATWSYGHHGHETRVFHSWSNVEVAQTTYKDVLTLELSEGLSRSVCRLLGGCQDKSHDGTLVTNNTEMVAQDVRFFVTSDGNPWIDMWNGPAWLFQSLVTLVTVLVGVEAGLKLSYFVKKEKKFKVDIPQTSLWFMLISRILGVLYYAVDPMWSRMIFNFALGRFFFTFNGPMLWVPGVLILVYWHQVTSGMSQAIGRNATLGLSNRSLKIFVGVGSLLIITDITSTSLQAFAGWEMATFHGLMFSVICLSMATFYIVIGGRLLRQLNRNATGNTSKAGQKKKGVVMKMTRNIMLSCVNLIGLVFALGLGVQPFILNNPYVRPYVWIFTYGLFSVVAHFQICTFSTSDKPLTTILWEFFTRTMWGRSAKKKKVIPQTVVESMPAESGVGSERDVGTTLDSRAGGASQFESNAGESSYGSTNDSTTAKKKRQAGANTSALNASTARGGTASRGTTNQSGLTTRKSSGTTRGTSGGTSRGNTSQGNTSYARGSSVETGGSTNMSTVGGGSSHGGSSVATSVVGGSSVVGSAYESAGDTHASTVESGVEGSTFETEYAGASSVAESTANPISMT